MPRHRLPLRLERMEPRELPAAGLAGIDPDRRVMGPFRSDADFRAALVVVPRAVTPASITPTSIDDLGGGVCPVCGQHGCFRHLDAAGRAYYETSVPPVAAELGTTPFDPPPPATGAPYALTETFKLHSRPTATKTLYLDFDGVTVTGTGWNTASFPTITMPAYNFYGQSYAVFEDNERATIQRIFVRVAEAMAPFDLDVTTQEPPLSDIVRSGTGDTRWGMRVAIGGDNDGTNDNGTASWMSNTNTAGIAYVGNFGPAVDTPAWCFTEFGEYTSGGTTYYNGASEGNVAGVIVHEVGHTFGLSHDGTTSTGYYAGHNSPAGTWSPNLGLDYTTIRQWSKGEYTSANNTEDDLSIIAGTANGFGYRADDHADVAATATQLAVAPGVLRGSGVVERNTDSDWFQFTVPAAGAVSLAVTPVAYGASLDVRADLFAASQLTTPYATSNPANSLAAGFNFTSLPAGTYYLKVDGVGVGDPFAATPTGYTDYGSLGQYFVSGTLPAGAAASVSGRVSADAAGNGTAADFQPLAGRTVFLDYNGDGLPNFLDLNGNGVQNGGEPSEPTAVSAADGKYTISAAAGTFPLRVAPAANEVVTLPALDPVRPVTLTAGATLANQDFALTPTAGPASISGTVYNDANRSGTYDSADGPLAGVSVWLDGNGNGQLDATERRTTTSAAGAFRFDNLIPNRTYAVRFAQPAGNTAVLEPAAGTASIAITPTAGQAVTNVNFGVATYAEISGRAFDDHDGDDRYTAGDVPSGGTRVFLDLDNDGTYDANETFVLTAADGTFKFARLAAGAYTVGVTRPTNRNVGNLGSTRQTWALTVAENQTAANTDFALYQPVKLEGYYYVDANGNNKYDRGEGLISPSPVVFNDLFDLGAYYTPNLGAGLYNYSAASFPDYNGKYSVPLRPGQFAVNRIAATPPTGYALDRRPGNPNPAVGFHTPTVSWGQADVTVTPTTATRNLQFVAAGSVNGTVSTDANGDGLLAGDAVRPGQKVYLDLNNNKTLDRYEPNATASQAGSYTMANVSPGTWTVRAVAATGYQSTAVGTVTVVAGGTATAAAIGVVPGFTVSGKVTADGVGSSGVRVYLDLNNNAAFDATEPTAVTAGTGSYSLTAPLPPGNYAVRAVVPAGYAATAVPVAPTAPGQSFTNRDFALVAAPTVASFTRLDKAVNLTGTVRWRIVFAAPVTGLTAAAFALRDLDGTFVGEAITGVTGGGTAWTVTAATGVGDGRLRLDYLGGAGVQGPVYNLARAADVVLAATIWDVVI